MARSFGRSEPRNLPTTETAIEQREMCVLCSMDILRPLNERKTRPESTLPVVKFVESYYLRFVEENYKPSTIAGYKSLWEMYLAGRLDKTILRDFRTVDAARLLAEIHRTHKLGRTTLHHIKSFLGGVFTYAKNQGVIDGVNPIHEAMIPKKAAVPEETHAATPGEVLAIMDTLAKAGENKARAAVALMFFAGLRPGEARGVCWEDFDGKRLIVRQSIWHTFTTTPKTRSSAKPVPVIEPLSSILAELRLADRNPTSGPILRGPSGKPLDLHNVGNRVVIPILKKAQPPLGWHGWYALRRGVATAVADLSDSLAAKGLLRHSSVSTTERHYIKDVPESTLAAMKQLEVLCSDRTIPKESKPS
jgi:integrase